VLDSISSTLNLLLDKSKPIKLDALNLISPFVGAPFLNIIEPFPPPLLFRIISPKGGPPPFERIST